MYLIRGKFHLSANETETLLAKESRIDTIEQNYNTCTLKYKGKEYTTYLRDIDININLLEYSDKILRARTIHRIGGEHLDLSKNKTIQSIIKSQN